MNFAYSLILPLNMVIEILCAFIIMLMKCFYYEFRYFINGN